MKKHLVFLLPIFLIAFAVYFGVWNFGFVIDDIFIVNNPQLHSFQPFSKFLFEPGIYHNNPQTPQDWRPLGSLVVATLWALFGTHAGYYHVFNLLLHLLDVGLIYLFVWKFSGKRWLAAAVALLIGIHPVLTEAVSYVAAHGTLLWLALFLTCCLLILYDKWPVLSWLLFALAVLTKESALPGIVAIFLIFWLKIPDGNKKLVKAALKTVPYLIIAVAFTVFWIIIMPSVQSYARPSLLIVPYTVWRYLSLTFWPAKLVVLDTQTSRFYPHSILDPGVLAGSAIIVTLLALIYLAWKKKWKEELLGLCWFAAFIAPFLQIAAPTGGIIGTRDLYAPIIGFFMALLNLGYRVVNRWRLCQARQWIFIAGIVAAIVLVAMTVTAFARNQDWKNSESLWTSTVRADPGNVYARVYLANFYLGEGRDPEKALEIIKEHMAMFPGHFNGWLALADSYAALNRSEEAEKEYLALLQTYPWSNRVQGHLLYLYQALGITSGIKISQGANAYLEIHSVANPDWIIHWQELEPGPFRIFLRPGEYYIKYAGENSDKFTIQKGGWLPVVLK